VAERSPTSVPLASSNGTTHDKADADKEAVQVKQFKVIAMFDYPGIDRSVLIEAIDARQALLRAVLDRRLPIRYQRDHEGNLQPFFWDRAHGRTSRWPRVEKDNYLVWSEDSGETCRLRFEVVELD
jgi:hypothetical protein